jgi:hypothetical protein
VTRRNAGRARIGGSRGISQVKDGQMACIRAIAARAAPDAQKNAAGAGTP